MINRREILEFLIRCDRFFTVKSTIKSDIKCQPHQGSVRSRLRQSEYCYFMCSVPLQSCSPFSLSFFAVKICFQLANIKFKSAPPLFGEQCIRNCELAALYPPLDFRETISLCERYVILRKLIQWNSLKIYLMSGKKKQDMDATFFFHFDQNPTNFLKRQVLIELCIFWNNTWHFGLFGCIFSTNYFSSLYKI